MKIKALVMAAGLGQRLRPLTDDCPKCLLPVGGRPLLDYWLDRLVACGVREVIVNTHAHRGQMARYIEAVNARGGIRVKESYEPSLLGTAGTVRANAEALAEADRVVVIYADNFSGVDLGRMLAFHQSHEDPLTMLLFRAEEPSRCGIAQLDDAGRIVQFVEKPSEPVGDLANGGGYVLEAPLVRRIAAMDAFDLGFDVLPRLQGEMRGWVFDGYHRDIGTHESYARAQGDARAILKARGYLDDGTRPCVFFDRDGTLLEMVHYLNDPAQVRLAGDAAAAIHRLRGRGFACVAVTNQSQLGNGLLNEDGLAEIHEEMYRQLASAGAMLDALYFCPVPPAGRDRTKVEHPDRKPGPGLLQRAARELGLSLEASWMIGDMLSDVLAGTNANCRGSVLLLNGKRPTEEELEAARDYPKAQDLSAAVDYVLGARALGPPPTERVATAPTAVL
jgi:histidinol-phosphate phosphatase family protein